jgi:hypothetical protein
VGSRAGLDEVEKRRNPIIPPPRRELNPCCPFRSLVTILTELPQLLQCKMYFNVIPPVTPRISASILTKFHTSCMSVLCPAYLIFIHVS